MGVGNDCHLVVDCCLVDRMVVYLVVRHDYLVMLYFLYLVVLADWYYHLASFELEFVCAFASLRLFRASDEYRC